MNSEQPRRYPKKKISWLNWIERRFTTPKVEGSSPSEITKNVNFKISKSSKLISDDSQNQNNLIAQMVRAPVF